MSIGAVSGSNGLPEEVLEIMNKLGGDLRRECHQAAIEQANLAQQKGHEQANNTREQADRMRDGAMLGAMCTGAGAALQVWGATEVTPSDLQGGKQLADLGQTTTQLGTNLSGIEQAAGKDYEADATQAGGDAAAANKRADSEEAEAAEAQKVIDRARDTYGQILSLQHTSMMAAIGGRA